MVAVIDCAMAVGPTQRDAACWRSTCRLPDDVLTCRGLTIWSCFSALRVRLLKIGGYNAP